MNRLKLAMALLTTAFALSSVAPPPTWAGGDIPCVTGNPNGPEMHGVGTIVLTGWTGVGTDPAADSLAATVTLKFRGMEVTFEAATVPAQDSVTTLSAEQVLCNLLPLLRTAPPASLTIHQAFNLPTNSQLRICLSTNDPGGLMGRSQQESKVTCQSITEILFNNLEGDVWEIQYVIKRLFVQ